LNDERRLIRRKHITNFRVKAIFGSGLQTGNRAGIWGVFENERMNLSPRSKEFDTQAQKRSSKI